ncbi:MAG: hypothetical protein WBC91_19745 [Phototrophicaceae bacterium]
MFVINSYSQLAKYLPGGVWHFVSRAGYYQMKGLSLKATSRAMVIENIWLILSAFFIGSLVLMFALAQQAILAIVVCFVIWLIISYIILRWTTSTHNLIMLIRLILLQLSIWLPLGLSYTMILPINMTNNVLLISISGFIISWLVGYVTIFAPGGIGTREIVLVAIMLLLLSPELSLFYATLHRLLWVLNELLLALIAFIFFRRLLK